MNCAMLTHSLFVTISWISLSTISLFLILIYVFHCHESDISKYFGLSRKAGPSTPVCDNGRSYLHDRLPVRVSHLCHQHLAFPEFAYIMNVLYYIDFSCTYLFSYTLAFCDNPGLL